MRVEPIGKRQYAFGLTWSESRARKPNRQVIAAQRKALDPTASQPYYHCVTRAKGRYALGGGIVPRAAKGKVYSYAATLAGLHADGVYVAEVDEGQLWFCVVQGGLVAPGTDVIDKTDVVLDAIAQYRSLLGLDSESTYAADGVAIPGGAQPFDPIAALAKAKHPVPLVSSSDKSHVLLIAEVAVVVVAGVVGYHVYHAHKVAEQHKVLTAEQRQQAIQAYESAARSSLASYPADPTWALVALTKVHAMLPVNYSGWVLQQVQCQPSACTGTYARERGGPMAVTPFVDRFGASAVQIDTQGKAIRVQLPLGFAPEPVTDAFLHNPPVAGMAPADWVGLAPIHVYGMSGDPTEQASNLAQTKGGKQVGFPDLMQVDVTMKGNTPVGTVLPAIVQWATAGGFRVTHWESRITNSAFAWTATVSRVSR